MRLREKKLLPNWSLSSLLRLVRGKSSQHYLTGSPAGSTKQQSRSRLPDLCGASTNQNGKAPPAAVQPTETEIQATSTQPTATPPTQPAPQIRATGFARAACGRFEAHWEVLMVDFPVWGSGLTLSEAEKDAVEQLQHWWGREGRGPNLPSPSAGDASRGMTLHKVALLQQERPTERLPAFSEYTMYIGEA